MSMLSWLKVASRLRQRRCIEPILPYSSVARLEAQLGLTLLDRSGYRVKLTDEGRLFHTQAQLAIREIEHLRTNAGQLATGEETVLRVVMGDVPGDIWLNGSSTTSCVRDG
ncbi:MULTISPECIES: LysR family transcriptional regulator [unclassified Mesorhizobium]|uniref:LysR family transcriptional regulator n=1 Tax=unclassified Mesorhizobium TaxID=325217 RepID=UPI0003CE19EA|nr:hypothetical protein X752_21285 [Mesorhizobium sp. LNJC398B00]ESY32087.1 hypothetical protein X748_24300 [Mesorhizobium sp. LNJC386A00]